MLKKFLTLVTALVLSAQVMAASVVDLSDPYKMVEQVADNTFNRVASDQGIIAKDKEHLRQIVQQELMPYVDYKYAAYRVLGSYIQKVRTMTDPAEKKQAVKHIKSFIDVFQRYLVATYAGVFTQY